MRAFIITMTFIVLSMFYCLFVFSGDSGETADMVLLNCNILTMDESIPRSEAMAINNGKILALGSNEEIKKYINDNTKILDLKQKTVMPGFIESHAHFISLGSSLTEIDLVGTRSVDEIVALVSEAGMKTSAGQWIQGMGWDQNDWENKSYPTSSMLDRATKDHPVILTRIDGHAIWVNSKAMELAGITDKTATPKGGEIIKDSDGKPSGIFIDNASELISSLLDKPTEKEIERYLLNAQQECFKFGITTFHDMGISINDLKAVEKIYKKGLLKIRLYEMVSADGIGLEKFISKGPRIGLYNGRLTVRGVKDYVDGALGSRGALLFEPYSDKQDSRGLQVRTDEELKKIAELCKKYGFQLSIHAIGDQGNNKVLNIYEKTIGSDKEKKYRWRIEHAQVLAPHDIERFGKLGVVPSMQPTHCTSDMPWAGDRLGKERVKGAYLWRTLIDSGAIIPGGSDAPVERINPLWGIYAAVTRKDHDGLPLDSWNPRECVSREEAMKMFTVWGAWVGFEENFKGKIKPGYLADIIVLNKDISRIPASEILKTEVLMTILGGEVVFKAGND